MRLRIRLKLDREVVVPINHQHLMAGIIYQYLERADAHYASFLHDDGYAASEETEDRRRFKLFTFSPLRAARRRVKGSLLYLGPGMADWLVSSPVERFLREYATGLLSMGEMRVGSVQLPIVSVESLPTPTIGERMSFTCLSPIVSSETVYANGTRSTRYRLPDDPGFGEAVRQNLLSKCRALTGRLPQDDRLDLAFDRDYFCRQESRGTKLIEFKGIYIRGAFAPLELRGSAELIRIGYECGLGEKNSSGFGMVMTVYVNPHN
jgi:CRISPR-associated endoribonuclease Cas6